METRRTERRDNVAGVEPRGFVETENTATNSIEVQRAKDGTYYWTIKVYYRPDALREDVLDEIGIIDAQLRRCYAPKGEQA